MAFISPLKDLRYSTKQEKEIKDCDYLVFIDADALVVDKITEEEFFTDKPLFGASSMSFSKDATT